jgi:hypothetical protein
MALSTENAASRLALGA